MSKKTKNTNSIYKTENTKCYKNNINISEILQKINSSIKGSTTEEAKKKLDQYSYNELQGEERVSPWKLIAEQFKSTLIILLLAAVTLSFVIGIVNWEAGAGLPEEITDAIVIFAIVIVCVVPGFVEEYCPGKAMAALRKMAAPTATIIRDGNYIEIPASELVPGDIVVLNKS